MIPSIEDLTRYTAPPEPKEEQWKEPEDYLEPEETTE